MATEPAPRTHDGFRLRGTSVTRIETFVDAAFAFGVTMMVISAGTLPTSVEELMAALHRVPAFAACFALLAMLWAGHNEWSRRFGLETAMTTTLSLLFVFVMLVWIYPLRMVFSGAMFFFTNGWVPSEMRFEKNYELQDGFLIYGVGFGALAAILFALNRIALRRRIQLGLNQVEVLETRRAAGTHAIHVAVAALSILLTFVARGPELTWRAALPGFAYALTGVAMWFHHSRYHRMRMRLERT